VFTNKPTAGQNELEAAARWQEIFANRDWEKLLDKPKTAQELCNLLSKQEDIDIPVTLMTVILGQVARYRFHFHRLPNVLSRFQIGVEEPATAPIAVDDQPVEDHGASKAPEEDEPQKKAEPARPKMPAAPRQAPQPFDYTAYHRSNRLG